MKKYVVGSVFNSLPAVQQMAVPRIRIKELLATRSPVKDSTGSSPPSSASSDVSSSSPSPKKWRTNSDCSDDTMALIVRHQDNSGAVGKERLQPLLTSQPLKASLEQESDKKFCPVGVVTPPSSVGDTSELAVKKGCAVFNKPVVVVCLDDDEDDEDMPGQLSSFFDEDDFDITIENNDVEGLGQSAIQSSGSSNAGGVAADKDAVPVLPLSTDEQKSVPKDRVAKVSFRRLRNGRFKATTGCPSSAGGSTKVNSELSNGRFKDTAARQSRQSPTCGSTKVKNEESDCAATNGGGNLYIMLGDEALMPRQSLKRDVKTDKRISYTTTKITGELNTSTSSVAASTKRRSQSLSAAAAKSPNGGTAVTVKHRLVAEAQQQQNGGLSDCSSSDSERRFSERRFTGTEEL